tara:strand:- start:448 stop:783 length:336 start_codon:yes stop_codon:yes gene_type:complete
MDELSALFGSLGISSEVISIVNEDMIAMARHYITQIDSQIEFSPNPICDYIDNDSLNRQILSHINLKGEQLLTTYLFLKHQFKMFLIFPNKISKNIRYNEKSFQTSYRYNL